MRTTTQDRGFVRVRVTLPEADYRAFTAAARILTRIMGAKTPATAAIIRAQLGDRRPVDIADGHLDAVGWPMEGAEQMGRAV